MAKQTVLDDPKPRAAPAFMANPIEPVRPPEPAPELAPDPIPAKIAAAGDANTIGSPDVFLHERFAPGVAGDVRVRQVWLDAGKRGYVISQGSQLGYFELDEGMDRGEAIKAVGGAYDRVAVIV